LGWLDVTPGRLRRLFLILLLMMPLLAVVAAHTSRSVTPPTGLVDGRLRPCPETPNCVSSEPGGAGHDRRVAALAISATDTPDTAWRRLREALEATGGVVRVESPGYLVATYSTRWLGFVDDLEARRDDAAALIQLRSASRVGRSDFGVNRRRVAELAIHFSAGER